MTDRLLHQPTSIEYMQSMGGAEGKVAYIGNGSYGREFHLLKFNVVDTEGTFRPER